LAEKGDQDKTGEMQMLEVSRQEIRKSVSEDARGLTKLCQELFVFWYCYIYDPIATGFRFVHLAIVFIPVIITVPVIWCGRRLHDGKGERAGAIWWYGFLVRSMERAGPAFIKVSAHRT
jgi:aarF domain-containing kinase